MTNILEEIIAVKRKEVETRKQLRDINALVKEPLFARTTLSMSREVKLQRGKAIIAEFKRRSPSKGIINDWSGVKEIVEAYGHEGAAGISILTDEQFFGGSLEDLKEGRFSDRPLLRKDFIIDEWQLYEAKAWGADVVLLIAACLEPVEVKRLTEKAKELGLEVLLELHTETELACVCSEVDMVGVNNRNLGDFSVNFNNAAGIAGKLGNDFIKIAESGISEVNDVIRLRDQGFDGFLIGTQFMSHKDPAGAFKNFIYALNQQ